MKSERASVPAVSQSLNLAFEGDLENSNFQDVWTWLVESHPDRLLCRVVPDDDGRSFAFRVSSAYRRIEKLVAVFRGDLKLAAGSRVLFYGISEEDLFLVLHASWLAGVVPMIVSADISSRQVAELCVEMNVQSVFFPVECSAQVAKLYHDLEGVSSWVLCGASSSSTTVPGLKKLEELVANAFFDASQQQRVVAPDQDALIVVRPGGSSIVASVFTQNALLQAGATAASLHPPVDQEASTDDIEKLLQWCLLPPAQLPGLLHGFVVPLLAHTPALIRGSTEPAKFFQQVRADRVAFAIVPIDVVLSLAKRGKTATFQATHGLSVLCYSDRRIPSSILARFETHFSVRVSPCYSITEAGGPVFGFIPDFPQGAAASENLEVARPWQSEYSIPASGLALHGVEWRIANMLGEAVHEEEAGALNVRTSRMMSGYVSGFEGDCRVLRDGFLSTGDEAFFVQEAGTQKLFITGRQGDFILRDGNRVNIRHVENVLMAIRGVRRVIVVAFENEFVGREIGAYVSLLSAANLKDYEILALARRDLSYDESPKVVIIARPGAEHQLTNHEDVEDLFFTYQRSDFRRRDS